MQLFRTQHDPTGDADPWNLTKRAKSRFKTPNFDLFSIIYFRTGEKLRKEKKTCPKVAWTRYEAESVCGDGREALGDTYGSSPGHPLAVWPRKSVPPFLVLGFHLYSKGLKWELLDISTKAALTAEEGKHTEVWEHSINWKLVFFL